VVVVVEGRKRWDEEGGGRKEGGGRGRRDDGGAVGPPPSRIDGAALTSIANGAPEFANQVSSLRSMVAPRLSELETNMYLYLRIDAGGRGRGGLEFVYPSGDGGRG
jgi:hypothetical protein